MASQNNQFGCLSSLFWLLITFGLTIVLLGTHPSEPLVRSIGGVFQFLGIIIVAWGIRDLRIEFKVPTWREGLRAELSPLRDNVKANLRRWLRRPHDTRVMTATGRLHIGGTASMTASGRLVAKSLPVEERLNMLAAEVESVKAAQREVRGELARHSEKVARDLAAEAEHRAEVKAELTGMITSLAVGGLRLETVGVCWLFAGTVLTTWPCEIARWLGTAC